MLLPVPIILMLATALALVILRSARPKFRFTWLIAMGGALLSLVGVLLWQIRLPQVFSGFTWRPISIFHQTPEWLGDGISWPLAVSLAILALGIILTATARNDMDPASWAGSLALCALGVASVTAGNPLTLVLVWGMLDLVELGIMLRSTSGGKPSEAVVVAFAARLMGIGLVLWAGSSVGGWSDFGRLPTFSGLFLLLASGFRLGVLPLHLPYQQDNSLRRGFGTVLRLISAASSIILLARLPAGSISSLQAPILAVLAGLAGTYAGWKWLRASDELTGRPFWVLGMASLAVAAALFDNPAGAVAWACALVLNGGLLFLYSARHRSLIWLQFIGLLGLSTFPFTLTASGWAGSSPLAWLFLICLPAQALLIAGVVRHALHPGESSLESQPRWVRGSYVLGLGFFLAAILVLGAWGWQGAGMVGRWWAAIIVVLLASIATGTALTILPKLGAASLAASRWNVSLPLDGLYRLAWRFYHWLRQVSRLVTDTLEGDGGILWSFLLLVLLLSVFASLR